MIPWSDAEAERLRELAADGLSASEIAVALNREFDGGRSRNSVIGKLMRAKGELGRLIGQPGFNKRSVASPPRRDGQAGTASSSRAVPAAKPILQLFSRVPRLPAAPFRAWASARDIVVVPLPFSRALAENRCLFFAADPLSPASADMLVCGCLRAEGLTRKPYCAAHLETEKQVRAAA